MAFSLIFGSSTNLFACNHFRRRRRIHRPEMRVYIRRGCPPHASPAIDRSIRHICILTPAAIRDGGAAEVNPSMPAATKDIKDFDSNVSSEKDSIALFVQMLGLENSPEDREHTVTTLWKYSVGGKDSIDAIMMFPGCVELILSHLKSDSPSAMEATAGLLRNISSVNLYRDILAESEVIEEITSLLHQSLLPIGVKEQCLCTLWNISIDEKPRIKIAQGDLLPLLVKLLDDEEIKVKEAVGGVLENMSLSPCNHSIMVEAGVIPKLADFVKTNSEGLKYIRKAAKSVLLELSKDDYYRILIIEDGLILVPLIGAAAYKSFRPQSHCWPSLPDGTEFDRTSRPSRYGATDLLLGLTVREKNINLDEAKMNAMVGRSQQQFLARIGAIELDDGKRSVPVSSLDRKHTLLPWMDGIARLVLFLWLEDVSAITRAAQSIADASSISENLRVSFKEAGAVKRLVQLLSHVDKAVQEAAVHSLDRLSLSYEVRQTIEAEGIVHSLPNLMKEIGKGCKHTSSNS